MSQIHLERLVRDAANFAQAVTESWLLPRGESARRRRVRNSFEKNWVKHRGSTCDVCGSLNDLELDHIRPVWAGGNNTHENFQTLCRPHHEEKTAAEATMYVLITYGRPKAFV